MGAEYSDVGVDLQRCQLILIPRVLNLVSSVPAQQRFRRDEPGEWREGTSPSRSLRTVRDSLPSYGSHSPAFFCLGRSVGSSPEGLTSKRP